ncbi:hypothetical protein KVR01_013162 [Diaporthe batatas]|uniref:uncharacterized protein n=1 Tax=Diaporthe batatas TaxID=748121 RepID=UPI001D0459AF|nr:uncharacterized protein KVR01_013162 [Diaporthe batatas]KAG8156940.1 hypothetical protein KVR01_013162 [Diaporthe batatas]
MDNHSSCPDPSFKFDPLPNPANHIRLLEIFGDDHHFNPAQVTCRLTTWPVDPPGLPSYHAISYTWGEPGDDTLIRLNEKSFSVRRNCEYVLRQARWHGKSQYYWVDAICIDQNNLHEKSKQVTMMGNIYKRAAHVLISWRFRLRHRSATTRCLLLAAARFAMRPYFTRLWILQELRNARDYSFLCGMQAIDRREVVPLLAHLCNVLDFGIEKASILWQPFEQGRDRSLTLIGTIVTRLWGIRRIMPQHLFTYLPPREYAQVHGRVIQSLELIGTHTNRLFELLRLANWLECADRRDNVYGIISLINWGDVAVIAPDYTQSSFQTAINFIRALGKLNSPALEWSFNLQVLSSEIVGNLRLDKNSKDVPEAIWARRGMPETIFTESELQLEDLGPLDFIEETAWCLSADHLDRSRAEYFIWTPTGLGDDKFYLPRWSRPGDWIVEAVNWMAGGYSIYLLVREVDGTSRGLPIGRCYGSTGIHYAGLVSTKFKIYWDIEDLVIICLVEDPENVGLELDTWLEDFLDIGVCRKTTPCSSFAIRIDGI